MTFRLVKILDKNYENNIDSLKYINALYLDFSKAFDTVLHGIKSGKCEHSESYWLI